MANKKPINKMTKEEILKKYPQSLDAVLHYHRKFVLDAMDEYAKQEIEAFVKWIDDEEIQREDGMWIKYYNGSDNYLTTERLYQIFKDEKHL